MGEKGLIIKKRGDNNQKEFTSFFLQKPRIHFDQV